MIKKVLMLLLLVALLVPNIVVSVEAHNPVWWNFDWNQRLEYTVNSTLIAADLVDFPVLVYVDSDLVNWGDVQNNLDDIRFVGDYLDELSFEIDYFVLNDEAWFWVRLPEVSSSLDTYFFMYFDNKFCTSGEDAEAVWDSNFVMVQHLNDATTSSILDSTSNYNDGTKEAANTPLESLGKIGKGQLFTAANTEYISMGNVLDVVAANSLTLECWVYSTDYTPLSFIIGKGHVDGPILAGNEGYKLDTQTDGGYLQVQDADSAVQVSQVTLSDATWYYVSGVLNRVTNFLTLYRNGAEFGVPQDVSGIDNISNANNLVLGAYSPNLAYGNLNGKIDEVRITLGAGAAGVRSAAWVGASYETQTLNLLIVGGHAHPPYISPGFTVFALLGFIFGICAIALVMANKKR